jgi:phenylacetic acid degradation operon negative regulatory protein
MRARTELFLHIVAEYFGGVFTPLARSRFAPFDPWNDSDYHFRQIQRLRQQAMLEAAHAHATNDRIYRLTEAGRLVAMGGLDPRARWLRPWDRTWRLVAFDVPESHRTERALCRKELRRLKFGCLQGSVWVSPDPLTEIRAAMAGASVNTQRLLFLEGRPAAGESDAEIVRNAWDFAAINKLYQQHRKLADALPPANAEPGTIRARLPAWIKREFALWKEILARDPFLPAALLPADYAGTAALQDREATQRRARVLAGRLGGE